MTRTAFTPTASADSRLTVSRLRLPALIACLLVLTLGGCSAAPSISAQLQQELDAAPAAQTLDDLPSFEEASSAFVTVAGNEPSFTDAELDRAQSAARSDAGYEDYSPLDMLGRCGTAEACLGPETMPTDKRGSISAVHPSGWQSVRYDFVDGESLYNRCHLIAFSLAGENANERNLITGTRYLNAEGMLPFEEFVADYVDDTGNHVLYRVTPVFEGANLVASGVQMEAQSLEDGGEGVSFNIYCYDVQPGVGIDYATGNNWEDGGASKAEKVERRTQPSADVVEAVAAGAQTGAAQEQAVEKDEAEAADEEARSYVLNTKSHRFHLPDCPGVEAMSPRNRSDVTAARSDLIAQGYDPCGSCNP